MGAVDIQRGFAGVAIPIWGDGVSEVWAEVHERVDADVDARRSADFRLTVYWNMRRKRSII